MAVPGIVPAGAVPAALRAAPSGPGERPGISCRRRLRGFHAGPPGDDRPVRHRVRGVRAGGPDPRGPGGTAPRDPGKPPGNPSGLRDAGRGGAAHTVMRHHRDCSADGPPREPSGPADHLFHDGPHRHADGILLVRPGAHPEAGGYAGVRAQHGGHPAPSLVRHHVAADAGSEGHPRHGVREPFCL